MMACSRAMCRRFRPSYGVALEPREDTRSRNRESAVVRPLHRRHIVHKIKDIRGALLSHRDRMIARGPDAHIGRRCGDGPGDAPGMEGD
jgi:hypothetical protein